MKKLLLVLLLPLFAGAQIIEFPDPNFKAILLSATALNQIAADEWGNYVAIDINGDGEINMSEASNIARLNIPSVGIGTFNGLNEFQNLAFLSIAENPTSIIPLSNKDFLTFVDIVGSELLTDIEILDCDVFSELHLSGNIPNMDFAGSDLLTTIELTSTFTEMVDLSNLPALNHVIIAGNFTDGSGLNLSGCQNLQLISLIDDQVFGNLQLNVSNCSSLNELAILAQQLESLKIDASNCTSLLNINITASLEELVLNNTPSLWMLLLWNASLTSLDVSESPVLSTLMLTNCPLTELDLHNNSVDLDVALEGCPVEIVNLKNGAYNNFWTDSEHLIHVCADEFEIAQIISEGSGLEEININSYCSFTPGGNYNTITGTVRFDLNGDGCDDSDLAASQLMITIDDGINSGATFTNADGNYEFYTNEGSFAIAPVVENPSFTVVPTTVDFVDNLNNTAVRDFCIVPNGTQPDLEVVILPPSQVSQASNPNYQILLRNKGNQSLSGTLEFNGYNITIFGEGTPPDTQNGSILTWNFSGLDPFETQTYVVAPYIPIFYAVGENFNLSANCTISGDVNPADNSFFITDFVDVAFDLRMAEYGTATVTCLQGATESSTRIGDYLHYMVRFENTGTVAVDNAVAKLVVDESKFDVSTFQMLTASHPSVTRINGNIVEIIFEDINLPIDDGSTEGYAAFKIKTLNSLSEGDSVAMLANVYFDYNFPIQTDEAVTTFTSLGVHQQTTIKLGVYPNPAQDVLNLSATMSIDGFEIYDMAGRIVSSGNVSAESQTIDVSKFTPGVYLVKAQTASGVLSAKWVKE